MASTNSTSHYGLSQYVGSDKPTYLTDYNNDMSAIDTGIYNAQTKADSAYTAAGEADTKAGNAQTTANTAVTNAGTANTNIGTMANLETSEKSTLVGAINEVNSNVGDLTNLETTNKTSVVSAVNEVKSNITNFNLTHFDTYGKDDITVTSGGTLASNSSITVAYNDDGSLAKIYGTIFSDGNATSNSLQFNIQTALRPTSNFSITNPGIVRRGSNPEVYRSCNLAIYTDGKVYLSATGTSGTPFALYYWPCLYFVKDFGDTPTP